MVYKRVSQVISYKTEIVTNKKIIKLGNQRIELELPKLRLVRIERKNVRVKVKGIKKKVKVFGKVRTQTPSLMFKRFIKNQYNGIISLNAIAKGFKYNHYFFMVPFNTLVKMIFLSSKRFKRYQDVINRLQEARKIYNSHVYAFFNHVVISEKPYKFIEFKISPKWKGLAIFPTEDWQRIEIWHTNHNQKDYFGIPLGYALLFVHKKK